MAIMMGLGVKKTKMCVAPRMCSTYYTPPDTHDVHSTRIPPQIL